MKKNFTKKNIGDAESVFLEKFWTEQWHEKGIYSVDCSLSDEWISIKQYFHNLPENAKILDVGCGTGEWVVWLIEKGFNVTGIDISGETIGRLNKKYGANHFCQGNVLNLNYPNDYFDIVYSWGLFEHFEKGPSEALSEARRVLKPGGKLILSVPYYNFRHSQKDTLRDFFYKVPSNKDTNVEKCHTVSRFYQWRFTKAEFVREIQNSSMNVVKIVPIDASFGVDRTLTLDFHLNSNSFFYKAFYAIIIRTRLLSSMVCHMLLSISEK